MPARKPQALITRHETAAEKQQRAERESSVRPGRELPRTAPVRLRGHAVAGQVWRRLVGLYGEIEGEIVTPLDQDLLIDYCLLMEQVVEMDGMRAAATLVHTELQARLAAIEAKRAEVRKLIKAAKAEAKSGRGAGEGAEGAAGGAEVEALEAKEEKLGEEYLNVLLKVSGAFDAVVKLDGRVDRKRALLLQWRQSLYLTPRARAGVAPDKKAEEEPPDELEQLLSEAAGVINGGR